MRLLERDLGVSTDLERGCTQSQIQANMNRRLTGAESGLTAYWRFDEGTGTTTADDSAHGLTGTLFGDAGWEQNASPMVYR